MAPKKRRIPIPNEVAARVLFASDRTCCVCNESAKQVINIHHIDDDPSNNALANLAVLCGDCHNLTQLTGGFSRKLDADQVILYRDRWVDFVAQQREAGLEQADRSRPPSASLELTTSLAEIHREREDYVSLVILYNSIGNTELRDKYIDIALAQSTADDELVIFFRGMQGHPERVPPEVAERRLSQQEQSANWTQRARTLKSLGRNRDAAVDYMKGVLDSLEEGNVFSAAYYLKELSNSRLYESLFIEAYSEEEELWWKVRALQELGRLEDCAELLVENEAEVRASGHPLMMLELERALGDADGYSNQRKEIAKNTRWAYKSAEDEVSEDDEPEGLDTH